MKKLDFEKTEYLKKDITPEGIAHWNKERRRMINKIAPSVVVSTSVTLLNTIILVAMSFFLQNFIDKIQATGKIDYIFLIILTGFIILQAVTTLFQNYFGWTLDMKGRRLVCKYLYKTALKNDEFLNKVKSGDIVQLLGADAYAIGQRMGARLAYVLGAVVQTIAILSTIFYFSWAVGIAVVIFYPLYFFVSGKINKRLEKRSYEEAKNGAKLSHVRLKGINGWLELAMLKKRSYYAGKYNKAFDKAMGSTIAKLKVQAVQMMFSVMTVNYLPIICIVVSTLPMLVGSAVSISTLLLVYMLAGYLGDPLILFAATLGMFSEDKALYRRMSDLLYVNPEEENMGEDVGEIKDIEIEIDDYSYGGEELLLKNCTLHAEKGDMVSVQGDSGCGKSTLFKLLVKQNPYELLHGSIQFNGMPVQSLNKDKLYDEMQYVSQNYFVFEDTLYNNLCMGDEFPDEQIDKVIDICCLNDFVKEYGLDIVMEENGKNISQGQLQRICIARSLLREPSCLLLDEPTSALDKATGDKLMENIAQYTKERGAITFVISHKDDAIANSNKSLLLAK